MSHTISENTSISLMPRINNNNPQSQQDTIHLAIDHADSKVMSERSANPNIISRLLSIYTAYSSPLRRDESLATIAKHSNEMRNNILYVDDGEGQITRRSIADIVDTIDSTLDITIRGIVHRAEIAPEEPQLTQEHYTKVYAEVKGDLEGIKAVWNELKDQFSAQDRNEIKARLDKAFNLNADKIGPLTQQPSMDGVAGVEESWASAWNPSGDAPLLERAQTQPV